MPRAPAYVLSYIRIYTKKFRKKVEDNTGKAHSEH